MAKNRKQLIHLHTPDVKVPEKDLLNLGEIAVQHNDAEAALYIQKNNGDIAKFIDATAVESKIETEKLRAEGAEGTLNGKIETLTSAVTDNEKVVATALNQIVKSVGLDENGNSPLPQNISLTDAIKDVTNKVSTLEGSNHTHANKAVLDGITAEKVTAWNSAKADAISSAKTYADSLNTAMDSRVDALETSSHSHDNKTVLDGITTAKVNAWNAAEANAKSYADSLAKNYDASGAAAQALKDAKSYVDGKVNGKFDDKGAAAQALSDAKTYADGLNTAMDGRVDVLETSIHTHSNKDVLDGITSAKVKAWDAAKANAISSAKTYADSLNTAMDGRVNVLEASSHTHTNKTVLDGITEEKVNAWNAAKADAISSAKTYTDATIEALNLASTYEAKGTAQNLINGLKLPETYAKKEVESTISTLVGKDTGKSVRSVSAEEVAKIVNGADTRYDTLKEIADWIISDTTGSAQMANDISALKAISAGTRLDTLESKSHTHDNKDLLDTYTQTESNLADAVAKKHEHTNKGVLDGITSAKVTAWSAAKADAISSAKTYADSLNTAMDGRVNVLEASSHTHGNKGVLDGITSVKVAAWDAAEANAISSAITYTDTVLSTIRIDCGTY